MKRFAPPLVSFGLCILVITLFLAVSTPSPLDTLSRFFSGTFSSWWYLGNMLNTAVLLIPAAIGSAVALRSGSLNLGGEAQLYAPALVTALLLSRIPDTVPVVPVFLAVLLAALATGAVLAAIPGILRVRFHASELLTSFLLSAALIPLLDYLVAGPLRDPGKNLLATRAIPETVRIPPIAGPSSFNLSVIPFCSCRILGTDYSANTVGIPDEHDGNSTRIRRVHRNTYRADHRTRHDPVRCAPRTYRFSRGNRNLVYLSSGHNKRDGMERPCGGAHSRQTSTGYRSRGHHICLDSGLGRQCAAFTRVDFDSTAILQAVLFLVISARTIPSIVQFRRKRP